MNSADRGALDSIHFRRPAHFPGIELACARYRQRAFPRHFHNEYVIGVMTLGVEKLSIRGDERVIRQGEPILIEPGETHSNRAADNDPFGYAVMYFSVPAMTHMLCEAFHEQVQPLPRFRQPHFRTGAVSKTFLRAHRLMMAGESRLSEESAFLRFLSALIFGGQSSMCSSSSFIEPRRVRIAREYIDAHFREAIPLRRLAEVASTSPFHLVRSFASCVGLPPGAYQTQLRIQEAKHLLKKASANIAEIALELGFADQSHLCRHFQRYVGTTPGRYRAQ